MTSKGLKQRLSGFTLIEVLVVVAIIALLIAILVPSLARARAQTRLLLCQSNLFQLGRAFLTYSVDTRGRLPGNIGDEYADWLGGVNGPVNERIYGTSLDVRKGKQPEWGTIFRKHMGGQKYAYTCPDHKQRPEGLTAGEWYFSYTANLLLTGARTEMLAGAHYRQGEPLTEASNFSQTDHTRNMRPFNGTPMLLEEDYERNLRGRYDGGWAYTDAVSDRHPSTRSRVGRGNITFHDGHVEAVSLPPRSLNPANENLYFRADSMCVRTAGRKWISGTLFNSDGPLQANGLPGPGLIRWGFLDRTPEAAGVRH